MVNSPISLKPIIFAVIFLSSSLMAFGQANRTWVSGLGDDMNSCSRTNPCKTFAGAIQKTNVGGEINVLDPAGYGSFTITKSITIDAPRSFAQILSAAVTGISINITAAADSAKTVRLRGLSINGMGTGTDGIRIVAAHRVFIEDVLVDGVNQHGINVAAPNTFVSVARSTIRNAAQFGINVEPSGQTTAMIAVESINVSRCETGLFAGRGAIVTVRDSAFVNNAVGVATQDSDVALLECLVAHGERGLLARSNSAIRISLTTVTRNQTGLVATGGKIISFKNNIIHGNGTDGVPTHTFPQA